MVSLFYIDTTNTEFKITPELIAQHYTDKTKVILLNYPTNPTGVILERDEVKRHCKLFERKRNFIISDEIYAENTFKGSHVSFAEFEEIRINYYLLVG